MNNPLISIIIPAYNRASVISETLDSVLMQTYTHWECIIVDDGSTDSTISVVSNYCDKDDRFQLHNRPSTKPKGANACRNYGYELAKGEYINWFDSDDLMHVDFLKERLLKMEHDNTLDFCCCINSTFTKTYENAIEIERPRVMQSDNLIEDYLLHGLHFYTPSPLWRKSFLKNKDLFDEQLQRSQESDFHFRMLLHNPKYLYLDEMLFYVRLGGESISKGAKTSLRAQLSVFRYFTKVFNAVKKEKKLINKPKIKEYVFYRQAVSFYNCMNLMPIFKQRIVEGFPLGKNVIRSAFNANLNIISIFKVFVGVHMAIFFRKGYKFLYFPQFNHRSYNE